MNPQKLFKLIQIHYQGDGLWGEADFTRQLPAGLTRGENAHLAYLTLVTTISGGRSPHQLWQAAQQTFQADPELFKPKYLAYIKPSQIQPRLQAYGLLKKPKTEATTWQRIGQALVMRANGSVQKLLKEHHHDAVQLLHMLQKSKTTFPVLSGPQTAPRWLYALVAAGSQTISGIDRLLLPPSPAGQKALGSLDIPSDHVPVHAFAPLDALGRHGCAQRKQKPNCPAASACPVAEHCQYSK